MDRYSHRGIRVSAVLVLACLGAVLLAGCSGGGGGGENPPPSVSPPPPPVSSTGEFSVAVPSSLLTYIQPTSVVRADLRVDNGTPANLTVDLNSKTVSGQVGDLALGTHSFELTFYLDAGSTKIQIARSTAQVQVVAAGKFLVTFGPYIYFDSDGDGFTNLAELASGTAWNSPDDKPKADFPRSSANYVLSDTLGIEPASASSVVAGSATGGRYTDSAVY